MSYQNVEIRVIRWERIWNYNREGMRDKMSNENVEIRVIKWERIWNYNKEGTNGERERERERDDNYSDCKPSRRGEQSYSTCNL